MFTSKNLCEDQIIKTGHINYKNDLFDFLKKIYKK